MLNKDELALLGRQLPFFEGLTEGQKELIRNNTFRNQFAKGKLVYSADAECLGVLLVRSGELRVYILSEDGREVTLYRLQAGDTCVLSAGCILKCIRFDVNIVAEQDTEVLIVNIAAFGRLVKERPEVENFSLRNTVERFSEVMEAMEQMLFYSMERRLANFLLTELDRSGGSVLKLTHEQIAKYIGSAREVVSRQLKVFQEEGLIAQSRGTIRILNEKGLEDSL